MFKVRVIPCLDVKERAGSSRASTLSICATPAIRWEAAIAYDAAGADELCFLDITATHENRGTMLDVGPAHRRKPASCR